MTEESISEIHEALRRCVQREDWRQTALLMVRRDRLLSKTPSSSKRAALEQSLECNRLLLERVEDMRQQTAIRLQALKRGRDSVASYASTQALPDED